MNWVDEEISALRLGCIHVYSTRETRYGRDFFFQLEFDSDIYSTWTSELHFECCCFDVHKLEVSRRDASGHVNNNDPTAARISKRI